MLSRIFLLGTAGLLPSLAGAVEPGADGALPDALRRAFTGPRDSAVDPAVDPFAELPDACRLAALWALSIDGDDDLRGRVCAEVARHLADEQHWAPALELAGRTPGFRGAIALADLAAAAARTGGGELAEVVERSLSLAERRAQPFGAGRLGQRAAAHISAAQLAAGDRSSSERWRSMVDLPDEVVLADALLAEARLRGGAQRDGALVPPDADDRVLRPGYLLKAQVLLDIVAEGAGEVAAPEERRRLTELLDDAVRWGELSKVDATAVRARASQLYRTLGEDGRADALYRSAQAMLDSGQTLAGARVSSQLALARGGAASGGEGVDAHLRSLRAALESVPVTSYARACASVATLAIESGRAPFAEELLAELLERGAANPNPRIGALAACYTALTYARTGSEVPRSLRDKIGAPPAPAKR